MDHHSGSCLVGMDLGMDQGMDLGMDLEMGLGMDQYRLLLLRQLGTMVLGRYRTCSCCG